MSNWKLALAATALTALTCSAQDKPDPAPAKYFQLTFVVRELDAGHVINSRTYSMVAQERDNSQKIRADQKVPCCSGSPSSTVTQCQQIDVGANFDVREMQEIGGRLSLLVLADISSVMGEKAASGGTAAGLPVIRSSGWNAHVIVPFKQPTIICSSDDPASTRNMQLQLTATPVP